MRCTAKILYILTIWVLLIVFFKHLMDREKEIKNDVYNSVLFWDELRGVCREIFQDTTFYTHPKIKREHCK